MCVCIYIYIYLQGRERTVDLVHISSTISYETPASARSTLSCPGIRPATRWDVHIYHK